MSDCMASRVQIRANVVLGMSILADGNHWLRVGLWIWIHMSHQTFTYATTLWSTLVSQTATSSNCWPSSPMSPTSTKLIHLVLKLDVTSCEVLLTPVRQQYCTNNCTLMTKEHRLTQVNLWHCVTLANGNKRVKLKNISLE